MFSCILLLSCGSKDEIAPPVSIIKAPLLQTATLNNTSLSSTLLNASIKPQIKLNFSQPLKVSTAAASVTLRDNIGNSVPVLVSVTNGDSAILIQSVNALVYLTQYNLTIATNLQSASGGNLQSAVEKKFVTHLDSSRKFPMLTDEQLLDKIQQQTLKYFWDFAHPSSGMIREEASMHRIL
ncbi:Ig-like domain-containing protein [Niabella sp. W65]|nr:Ig-like domain-containing protein [Niabella sp. W65]MCH7369511.1 Ig-like domain-containing protein [Niabella sp. W65]ULT45044.1 Ig-like domain-containing protein [Niabella sp. I65]